MGAKMSIRDSFYKKVEENRIKQALHKAVTDTALDLQKALVKEAPGPGRSRTDNPTGNLRRSHSYEVRLSSSTIEAIISNSANYWQFVQFGTSRMDADDFVTRALSSVEPGATVKKHFHEYYNGGG